MITRVQTVGEQQLKQTIREQQLEQMQSGTSRWSECNRGVAAEANKAAFCWIIFSPCKHMTPRTHCMGPMVSALQGLHCILSISAF